MSRLKLFQSKFWRSGDPFVWLTGGALATSLILVAGLVVLVLVNGLGFFWPSNVTQLTLKNGDVVLGEIVEHERYTVSDESGTERRATRLKLRRGNREFFSRANFLWVNEDDIVKREEPLDATVFERREWGNFYGFIDRVRRDAGRTEEGPEAGWTALQDQLPRTHATQATIRRIEKKDIGAINHDQEKIRLELRRMEMAGDEDATRLERLSEELAELQARYDEFDRQLASLREGETATVTVSVPGGYEKEIPLAQIVEAYRPNAMGSAEKIGSYFATVWGFITEDPRESNTEGGVFPAIFGTVLMVFIMTIVVTPFGILAAFYLREYAKQGFFVSAVRIAVNNLAGVPSIVFGVFGVGFFIYFMGGSIDRLFFPESLPTPTYGTGGILWASLTLALLTLPVVIVATEEGLAAIPGGLREASLALGATKFETAWKVVLPSVMPAILTGLILSIARAAGEVAPLMLTGVVKLAPSLPVDGYFPFVHLDRKFMHLGFHIYDVGFQSPNADAAKAMVFTTTLLLIMIVIFLNLIAILLRRSLRKRMVGHAL